MKLVDEKGRLFGLINPLDLVILLAVVALVAGLATKTKTIVQTTSTEIQFEAMFKRVHPEVAANVKANEPLVGAGGFVEDAKIESIRIVPSKTSQANAQGQMVISEDPHFKDIHVVVRGISRSPTVDFKVGGQEIKAGKEYWLKTQFVQLQGVVENVKVIDSK